MISKVFGSSLATLLFPNKVYRQNKKHSKAFREKVWNQQAGEQSISK
ncbi:hypothetical protein DU19_0819 [Chlamydia muridarum]|nr:hypothetical protein TAC_03920 [Chlamydia muridarum str. Nigg3 CMUT3-5]AHH24055.1 hypothetical protein Y015_03920 [Chlamydia muridarum str. Nigg CM972]KDU80370.1 hypothetical protein DU17_0821 [Chlamydia muridarum]KDU81767.1 hypothetical protein DU18_0819 [Chlamydia muridarum]KDU82162.1 hypothetical protein DU19_0819 [Chlamydia muridarum]